MKIKTNKVDAAYSVGGYGCQLIDNVFRGFMNSEIRTFQYDAYQHAYEPG